MTTVHTRYRVYADYPVCGHGCRDTWIVADDVDWFDAHEAMRLVCINHGKATRAWLCSL